jgi:UPF0176 protein
MPEILNIAAYRFVQLDDTVALRPRLQEWALAADLKGTVLLAPEGINLFLAGPAAGIGNFLDRLRGDPRFEPLQVKESWSATVPFKRLRVRLKREIIRMNCPTIRPELGRAAAVDAVTLKRWLDAGTDDVGRPLLMLDTRNQFEVEAGRFEAALHLGLHRFSEFPEAVAQVRAALEGKAVVTYCTGGIRCEKAALYLDTLGLQHHRQLEGGILKYFEDVGAAHFNGACIVFDARGALDGDLAPD